MATCSSTLAWRRTHGQRSLVGYSPWGWQRVRYNWATKHALYLPLQCQHFLHIGLTHSLLRELDTLVFEEMTVGLMSLSWLSKDLREDYSRQSKWWGKGSKVNLCWLTKGTGRGWVLLGHMEFSRQEYWSKLPCLPPGDLPNPGIDPRSLVLQVDSLLSEPPGEPGDIVDDLN